MVTLKANVSAEGTDEGFMFTQTDAVQFSLGSAIPSDLSFHWKATPCVGSRILHTYL